MTQLRINPDLPGLQANALATKTQKVTIATKFNVRYVKCV